MKKIQPILFLTIFAQIAVAQTAHQSLRKGDADYSAGNFAKAEENYRRSLEAARSDKAKFNLGNSVFQQKRYDDAIKQYDDAAQFTSSNLLKSNALHNKGNAYFWKGEYDKAADAYKQSLRANPSDEDTKRNLALTKKFLAQQKKEQQRQEEEQKKNPQNLDKNDGKNAQNQPPNDPKNQPPPPKNGDKNDDKNAQNVEKNADKKPPPPPQNGQNPSQNPQQPTQQDLKKDDARRMLQIMDDEERKVQKRLKKGDPRPSRSNKDW